MSLYQDIQPLAETYAKRRDMTARERIVERLQPYLSKKAELFCNHKPKGYTPDMALSAANLGLLQALETYDPARGVKFLSYATHRAEGAMLDDVREEDTTSRVRRQRTTAYERQYHGFHARHGRYPTPEECPLPATRAVKFGPITEDHALSFVSTEPIPTFRAEHNDDWDHLTKGMERRERMAFVMHYRDGIIMRVIAETLGLSESRVCQILQNLRKRHATAPEVEAVCGTC